MKRGKRKNRQTKQNQFAGIQKVQFAPLVPTFYINQAQPVGDATVTLELLPQTES